jgi:2'-5' RNA ligase
MAQTAIIVPLPEAEPLLGPFRYEHTESGPRGAPPHVTLLFPFTDSESLLQPRIRQVAEIVGAVPAFDVSLVATAYFDASPRILYVRPEPDEPFRRLTHALVEAFPEHPPYEGTYEEVIPHATVAIAEDHVLAEIERALAPLLPQATRVTDAALMVLDEQAGRWVIRERFPLGASPGAGG